MDEEKKDIKPKLDYDEVIEFIDERITCIEKAAKQMEVDTMKAQSKTRNCSCCLQDCWRRCRTCMRRCLFKWKR